MRASVAAALLLALAGSLLGCAAEDAAGPTEPAPSTPRTPAPADPTGSPDPTDPGDRTDRSDTQPSGTSTGMDVRHLNPDGSVSTVEVPDFPR